MNVSRVRRDLSILLELRHGGEIRGVDWSPDARDPWIIVHGAFQLPPDRFNLPNCNLKLPLPANVYDRLPGFRERYAFYSAIFIDDRLRRRGPGGGWEPIPRQYRPDGAEAGKGWAFLCVQPGAVGQETDIRAVFPIVQRFMFNPR